MTSEIEELRSLVDRGTSLMIRWKARAEAAEAKCARLTRLSRDVHKRLVHFDDYLCMYEDGKRVFEILREIAALSDTAQQETAPFNSGGKSAPSDW